MPLIFIFTLPPIAEDTPFRAAAFMPPYAYATLLRHFIYAIRRRRAFACFHVFILLLRFLRHFIFTIFAAICHAIEYFRRLHFLFDYAIIAVPL